MERIRFGRVVLGGILAGFFIIVGEYVLNGMILNEQWTQMGQGLGALGPAELAAGSLITLSYGIVLVWLYAAMRPRFASELSTKMVAAYTFWFIAYFLFLSTLWVNGIVTGTIALVSIAWGVVEAPLAALVGVKVYGTGQSAERPEGAIVQP